MDGYPHTYKLMVSGDYLYAWKLLQSEDGAEAAVHLPVPDGYWVTPFLGDTRHITHTSKGLDRIPERQCVRVRGTGRRLPQAAACLRLPG